MDLIHLQVMIWYNRNIFRIETINYITKPMFKSRNSSFPATTKTEVGITYFKTKNILNILRIILVLK